MPLSYYPGMDDLNYANPLRTITPSVPPADHGIPLADHGISIPPPSTDKNNMLPPPTPSTKGKAKKKDESNVGGLLMNLADDGSEDGTSTPTEKDAGTIPPGPTENEARTTLPATTGKEAGTTPEKPTNPKQRGTPKPDQPATPGSKSSSSDDDNTEDEEYVSSFLEWVGLNLDCKRMLDDETKMLAHHETKIGNKAVPILQQALNKDPELFTEAQAQITVAVYVMCEAIVLFDTRLGNISYFASGQGKRKADTDGDKGKRVHKEWESCCLSFGFMVFLSVYGLPLSSGFFL